MSPKGTKKSSKKQSALKTSDLKKQISELNPEELFSLFHSLREVTFFWIGNPSKENLLKLKKNIPHLDKFIDFNIVFKRLDTLNQFEQNKFGVQINDFLPELILLIEYLNAQIESIPQGISKAEFWLTSIAKHANADADLEAAIYLASRG